jgi:ATP-binding cassette subfamily F protein 3
MWLEDYIEDSPITVVIVSHDRGFLNALCDNIIHFHNKQLNYYAGNYDQFIQTR